MMSEKKEPKFKKIKIGITHGDINGISYEITLKAFRDPRMLDFFIPIIYGSAKVAAYYKKILKIIQVSLNHIKNVEQADKNAINIINCVNNNVRVELGQPTKIAGEAAISALNCAIKDLKEGKIDVLVTNPISKPTLYGKNFNFKGHTWFLAKKFGADDVLMLMVHDNTRIGVVTDHVPLGKISEILTKELIISKLRIFNETLKKDFVIDGPLIAVLGLNPHAGDQGLIGDEEQKVIIPAIEQAKEENINVLGPYAADGFFASGNYKNFDGILAMYHDQGLIPFKILSNGQGVNFTAGLPIIRTSPDHGVAYDIAGLNKADHSSFTNALFLARTIFKNRNLLNNVKPLEKQNMEELVHTLKPMNISEEVKDIQKEDNIDQVEENITTTEKKQEEKFEEKILEKQTKQKQQETEKIQSREHQEQEIITDETAEKQIEEPIKFEKKIKNKQQEGKKQENNKQNQKSRKFLPHRNRENLNDYSDLT